MKLSRKIKRRYEIYRAVVRGTPIIANLKLSKLALGMDISNLLIHSCDIDPESTAPQLVIERQQSPDQRPKPERGKR